MLIITQTKKIKRKNSSKENSPEKEELDLKDFILSNPEIKKSLIDDSNVDYTYIIPAVNQYRELEEQFKVWEREAKQNKEIKYPKVELPQLRDDVVDYSDELDLY